VDVGELRIFSTDPPKNFDLSNLARMGTHSLVHSRLIHILTSIRTHTHISYFTHILTHIHTQSHIHTSILYTHIHTHTHSIISKMGSLHPLKMDANDLAYIFLGMTLGEKENWFEIEPPSPTVLKEFLSCDKLVFNAHSLVHSRLIHILTSIRTHTHISYFAHILTHIHTQSHTHISYFAHIHTQSHTHMCTVLTLIRTQSHIHTSHTLRTYIHTHTHTIRHTSHTQHTIHTLTHTKNVKEKSNNISGVIVEMDTAGPSGVRFLNGIDPMLYFSAGSVCCLL